MGQRGLEHAGDPDGPDLLQHGPPMTAGGVGAACVPERLPTGHLVQAEITTDGDMVNLRELHIPGVPPREQSFSTPTGLYIFNSDVAAEFVLLDLVPCPGGNHMPNGERSSFNVFQVNTNSSRRVRCVAPDCLEEVLGFL